MQRSEVSVAAPQAGAKAAPVVSLVQLPHLPEASRRSCRFFLASTAKQSIPLAKATHSGRAASEPPTFCQAAHFLPSRGSRYSVLSVPQAKQSSAVPEPATQEGRSWTAPPRSAQALQAEPS